MIKHTLTLFKTILSVKSWPPFQLFACITEVLIGFSALILLTAGVSEKNALGLIGILMLVSAMVILKTKENYKKNETLSLFLLSSIGVVSLVLYSFLQNEYRFLLFVLGVGIILATRDLMLSSVMAKIRLKAISNRIELTQVTALMMMSGACLTIFFTGMIGFIIDQDIERGIEIAIVLMITLTIANTWVRNRESTLIEISKTQDGEMIKRDFKAPMSIYVLCLLSSLYNATAFVGKRFIVPLLVLKSSEKLGLSDSVFTNLAMIAGFMALISLIKPKGVNSFSSKKLMLVNFHIGMIFWIVMTFGFYWIEHVSKDLMIVIIGLLLLTYLVLEVTTKLWSVGFINELKVLSECDSIEEKYHNDTYQKYLNIYMYMKNIGSALGFFIAYLIYNEVGIIITMTILASLAICYGLFSDNFLYRRDLRVTADRK